MYVAQLTYDHLDRRKGNLSFTDEAFDRFWGRQMFGENSPLDLDELEKMDKTEFRLYDDDDILYYTGWLKNDEDCLVQQFVLSWAMADSGCTRIDVKKGEEWLTEIS